MSRHTLRAQANGIERRIHRAVSFSFIPHPKNIIERKLLIGTYQEKVLLFRRRRKTEDKITVGLKRSRIKLTP
jgi:hypothetical protein